MQETRSFNTLKSVKFFKSSREPQLYEEQDATSSAASDDASLGAQGKKSSIVSPWGTSERDLQEMAEARSTKSVKEALSFSSRVYDRTLLVHRKHKKGSRVPESRSETRNPQRSGGSRFLKSKGEEYGDDDDDDDDDDDMIPTGRHHVTMAFDSFIEFSSKESRFSIQNSPGKSGKGGLRALVQRKRPFNGFRSSRKQKRELAENRNSFAERE